jgi:tetratricopeptide (TPR) repeat protein
VADRLLVDLESDGRVTVGIWPDGGLPETVSRAPLAWPLDDGALEELRWYLEDYLRAPFGVYEDRGPQVQASLAGWGRAVFASVFGPDPARDAYQRARDGRLELVFRSSSPGLLGLPWELMDDGSGPVALRLGGVSRALRGADLAQTIGVPGGRLRVLMVIARPAGTGDVPYRMIARRLLERLDAVRGEVDLVVLRPPSLDALRDALARAAAEGGPFQVVHFDGHGLLPSRRSGGAGAGTRAGEGMLVFEKPGGGDHVPASKVASVLAGAGVPVVVLNACQSGAAAQGLEASVATALLRAGTVAVVAMAYSVYAVAAAEFMAVFYERLFAGDSVGAAVTAGRRRLFEKDLRPSPKGEMQLADWLVPVHYLRGEVSFPQARTARPTGEPSLEQALDRLAKPATGQGRGAGSLDPVGSFTGRDDLFYELEATCRLQRVVVLHGSGGTGKTELAKAFGRWWRDTGGIDRPGWVLWHSFEPGVASFGLDGIITEIGLAVFGPDFARLDPGERGRVVEQVLAERRLLLIWDNFETVRSMPDPDGATPRLGEAGCDELKAFASALAAGGRSALIITSRASEDWLGPVRRIRVGGLASEEAAEYAGDLLAPYPSAAPRRARRAFAELLEALDGHPLSMRLILPRLDDTEPETLLDGLRGSAVLPGGEDPGGHWTSSLAASITYSFTHLSAKTHRLLPAVCLFRGVAHSAVLAAFSLASGVPDRFAGASLQDWEAVLRDAALVGLLTPLGTGMYQVHPALPGYLAALWRAEDPDDHDSARDAATQALVTACALLADWLSRQIRFGDAGTAYTITGLQRRTLGAVLGYALDHQMWQDAEEIARPLSDYCDSHGFGEEAGAWTDRVRLATEGPDGTPPRLGSPAGDLWLFVTGEQANRQQRAMRLDEAERTYRQILAMFEAQPASPGQRDGIATACHSLGVVAQRRAQLDDAEAWYLKSLAISEELDDRPHLALSYHHLGAVAQERGRLDDAEAWYLKSVAIFEEIGDRSRMASSFHNLGVVAQQREQLDDAEAWYLKSMVIFAELGDRSRVADSYHQIGIVAQLRQRLDSAEDWHLKSLAIKEELGDRSGMGVSYQQLGVVAHHRGRLDDAEAWYLKSLAVKDELGNRPGMATSYGRLGLLAEQRGQPHHALESMIRCVSLFAEFPHPAAGPGPEHLARLTTQLGMPALETSWQHVTGSPLPLSVRDYVRSHQPGAGDQ